MNQIMKCVKCGRYTMNDVCCGGKTVNPGPAKFSPEDKYANYRREAKRADLVRGGVL